MDSFFSKAASSFLSSQAEDDAPPKPAAATHPPKHEEESADHRKPASTGGAGYGDLLSGMQTLMQGGEKKSASGGGGSPTESGYGNLLAGGQAMMGHGAKPKKDSTSASSGDGGDVMASAQVLMKAAKERGQGADMGEAAGAAANLIGAATRYGGVEKTSSYGQYADKAQTYLHDYQASHRKPGSAVHEGKTPSKEVAEDGDGAEAEIHPPSKAAPIRKPEAREEDDESRE